MHSAVQIKNQVPMNRNRILVPLDIDVLSDSALEFARNISTRMNAMVTCLYVMEDQKVRSNKPGSAEAKHMQRRSAENRLSEKVNSVLNGSKIPFELIVSSGKVHEKILEKAVDLNVQLIIMCKLHSSEDRKKRIGTTTKHIISNAHVPVIITGRQNTENKTNIIVPLDIFKPIGSQIICAIDTANSLCAAVTVVSIIEKEKVSLRPEYLKRLNEVRLMLRDHHIHCNSHLLTGHSSIPEDLLSFSKKVDSGLILMLTSNERRSKVASISSITKEIFIKSELPVQFINPNYKSKNLPDKSEIHYKLNSLSWSSVKDHLINNQQELET